MHTTLLLLSIALSTIAHAATCGGFTSVNDSAKLTYPPIARAAHVSGNVIMMVSFDRTGKPESIQTISGSPMLRQVSEDYVRGWRANEFSGPRNCPIVITFHIGTTEAAFSTTREDVQHVTITAPDLTVSYTRSVAALH